MSEEYIKFVPFVCDNFEADLRHFLPLSLSVFFTLLFSQLFSGQVLGSLAFISRN